MRRKLIASAVGLTLTAAMLGCGSGNKADSSGTAPAGGATTSGGTSAPANSSDPLVAEAKANIAKLTQPAELSGGTPVKPNTGKTLGILSCGFAAPVCQDMAANAQEAAKSIGWTSFLVDGKLTAQGWAAGMSQVVAKKPDLIYSVVASDAAMPQALDAAAAANIPVVCSFCGNPYVDAVKNGAMSNIETNYNDQGKALADYIISESDGKAKVAVLTFNLSTADLARSEALVKRLKECSGCTVLSNDDIGVSNDQFGIGRKAATALLAKYPKGKIDWISSPADSFTPGITQAIKLAGRDDVKTAGYDCNPALAVDDIRSGDIDMACADSPTNASSWAAVDQLARIDAGQPFDKIVNIPYQFVTKDNVPAKGAVPFTFDYKSYYKNLWGVS
ncbi:MAG: ribose transport system substrate-binding protein [Solirubrobacteraceae bacterium]|jgi:ribose transport system substrate-binding protein|nr:ribose transport system substrate-binding protein [Solirubrobacteraceae bacterium]